MFELHSVSQSVQNASSSTGQFLKTVILMMNTRCLKHVDGTKKRIKTLIYKVSILSVNITQYIISCSSDRPKLEDTTNPKTRGDWRQYVQN
jgi:hypothetical protein